LPYDNFNDLLHELRTRELRRVPPGAKVFLSAGCAGRWYFDWISENYPGIERHLGVEAYEEEPADLPENAVWLRDPINRMSSVPDSAVDLVFAGQTIEHLWPHELTGFLSEARRVLRPDGLLVMDSPNRSISESLGWHQPQHTMELTVGEIQDLVMAAGFRTTALKGIWLCRGAAHSKLLPLIPDLQRLDGRTQRRIEDAAARPEDSFIWWLEARKDALATPDVDHMTALTQPVFDLDYGRRLQRVFSQVGRFTHVDGAAMIAPTSARDPRRIVAQLASAIYGSLRDAAASIGSAIGAALRRPEGVSSVPGCLRHGPYIPLRPGRHKVVFTLEVAGRPGRSDAASSAVAGFIDVSADNGDRILARKDLLVSDLERAPADPAGGGGALLDSSAEQRRAGSRLRKTQHELLFELSETTFGVEFRVFTTGRLPFYAAPEVELVTLETSSSAP